MGTGTRKMPVCPSHKIIKQDLSGGSKQVSKNLRWTYTSQVYLFLPLFIPTPLFMSCITSFVELSNHTDANYLPHQIFSTELLYFY